jgi:hypothetical protein
MQKGRRPRPFCRQEAGAPPRDAYFPPPLPPFFAPPALPGFAALPALGLLLLAGLIFCFLTLGFVAFGFATVFGLLAAFGFDVFLFFVTAACVVVACVVVVDVVVVVVDDVAAAHAPSSSP